MRVSFTGSARIAVAAALAGLGLAGGPPAAAAPSMRLERPAKVAAEMNPPAIPAFCDELRRDGTTTTIAFLSRGVFERNDGTLNEAGIDARVDPGLQCGLEVAVRVGPKAGGGLSALPADIDHYARLLTELASYLGGRVRRYAIDNETASPAHWDGTAAQYFELVRRSATAIRAGDPDAIILDGTMASGAMSAVMVADLYARGRHADALALAQEMQANELGGGPPVTDMDELAAFVNSPKTARMQSFFAAAVANQNYYDAFQLHYYGPWRGLADMFDFAREHGIEVPIEAWEVGRRFLDGRPFSERGHADDTARMLATAAGEGSAWSMLYSYLGSAENDMFGLLSFDGSTDHEARYSYREAVAALSGATSARRLDLSGDAWGYRFAKPDGELVGAWSDPGRTIGIGDELIRRATTAAVTDGRDGHVRHVRLDRLALGGMPQYLRPDLPLLHQVGRAGLKRRVRVRVECPTASRGRRCRGTVVLSRRSARPQPVGRHRFDLRRGAARTLRIRVRGRGRARRATAYARPCGLTHGRCRSWTRLR